MSFESKLNLIEEAAYVDGRSYILFDNLNEKDLTNFLRLGYNISKQKDKIKIDWSYPNCTINTNEYDCDSAHTDMLAAIEQGR